MITALYIGTEKLDLFKDNNIVIKNSVSKIEDITKVFTNISNDFSVPASDHNNKIFKHYYNASINDPFDARKLVLGAVYLSGLHYETVNFRLKKVILKSQKAESYSLEFFGLLTQLKELLKEDKLADLDMSIFDFNLSYAGQIKPRLTGLNDSVNAHLLTSNRYIYNSNSAINNTETIKNLANNNTSNNSGLDWVDVSFSIANLRVINAIEEKYGLTFSRDFFGTQAFTELFLLLNGGNIKNQFKQQVVFDSSNDPTLENNRILLSTNLTANPNTYKVRVSVFNEDSVDVNYTTIVKANGIVISESKGINDSFVDVIKTDFENFENITFEIISEKQIRYNVRVRRFERNITSKISTRNAGIITGSFNVTEKMPDIKIIDYLKGLFQTYKLIVIPTSKTELYVTTLNDYYRNGKVRDITEYIDFSETPVSVGKMLNEINYKFEDAQTVLAKQFKTINKDIDYGNLELNITEDGTDQTDLIDGEKLEYKLPFENMVYEKLSDINGEDNVNVLYGLMTNDSFDAVAIKPHLHYINNVTLTSSIKVRRTPTTIENIFKVNVPSHTLGYIAPQFSTVFGEEFNEFNGSLISNTLYSNYHKDYIDLIFNPKKRSYNFKIKDAPLDLIKNMKLNDAIVIKGKGYRIDNLETNIITSEISLSLINSLNQSLTPIEYLTTSSNNVFASSNLTTNKITVAKSYNETLQ